MYDLVIKNGTIVTAADTYSAEIGIKDGKIATIGTGLEASDTIDATGKLVLPGGIEAHCHIAQESATGGMTADDYRSGSISAAFGGNSCFVPFAAQHRNMGVIETLDLYDSRAQGASVIDYGYHLIVADPTEKVLAEELPEAFRRGVTSFKVFMTYDLMKIDDRQFLDILSIAKENGALTMVHAENSGMIAWMSERLVEAGHTQPRYHAVSHPSLAESEAINRAISLAKLVDAPLLIVHVSTPEGAALVSDARMAGAKIFFSPATIWIVRAWRAPSSCARLRCETAPRKRRCGGIFRPGRSACSRPITRLIVLTKAASLPKGPTPPSSRLQTGCRGSRCACRCCFPRASPRDASPCNNSPPSRQAMRPSCMV